MKGGKCCLRPPHTGLLLSFKISPADRVGQTRQTQGLVLGTGNSVSIQSDTEMVAITGENINVRQKSFPSFLWGKDKMLDGVCQGKIWPAGTCLEHPEGYSKLHPQKANTVICCLGLNPISVVAQRSILPTTLSDHGQDHFLEYENEAWLWSCQDFIPSPITVETLR